MKNFLLHFQVLTHKKKLSTYYEKKNSKMLNVYSQNESET